MIDRGYALDEVVEASRYVESGQKTGNVVLRIGDDAAGEAAERGEERERKPSDRAAHASDPG